MQKCNGTDSQHELYSHFLFDVMRSTTHGYIEELWFKQNHKFDINKMTLSVNPITCYSGKVVVMLFYIFEKKHLFKNQLHYVKTGFTLLLVEYKINCVYVCNK